MLLAGGLAPANPAIPSPQPPSRRTEGQPAQPAALPAANQIPQLGPTQRTGAQIMMLPHQLVPESRNLTVATANRHQLHRPQLSQPAAHPSCRHAPQCSPPRPLPWLLPRTAARRWQNQLALLFQTSQGQSATHLLQPTVRPPPIQPLADLPRQGGPRQLRFFGHHPPNSRHHLVAELLPANPHAGTLQFHHPLCPAKKIRDTINPTGEGEQ